MILQIASFVLLSIAVTVIDSSILTSDDIVNLPSSNILFVPCELMVLEL